MERISEKSQIKNGLSLRNPETRCEVNFNGVTTNIKTREQYERLLAEMVEFFVRLKYPDYKITKIKETEETNIDGRSAGSPDGLYRNANCDITAVV
jgi:hypothetical protein